MKKTLLPLGISVLLALGAQASQTNLFFTPGNIIVMRGGDGVKAFSSANKQNPIFLDEYNTVTNNQLLPIVSEELPTNGPQPIWFNASAGSEGQGLTRSADHRLLAVTGYTSPINEALGTPSSVASFNRGFGVVDCFSNLSVIYSNPENWYGMPPGITQDNPRGIATLDGTNFWGVGTVAGTQTGGGVQETGTLFYNPGDEQLDSGDGIQPAPIQTILSSMYYVKVINGVLYADSKISQGAFNNGIWSFSTDATHTPDPLPWVPGESPAVVDTTNLVCDFTAAYPNILTFDMDDSNTVVYAADNQYGIVKFTNNGAGGFNFAYLWNSNNIETAAQPAANQGCFGLVVDFSQSTTNYNIIYATTMEEGDTKNVDGNRLIRIVDTGAPDSVTPVEQTLAKAQNNNEDFRGLALSPDVRPFFTQQPQGISTIINQNVALNTAVSSPYAVTYQWQDNGTNLADGGGILGSTSNILTFQNTQLTNGGNYFLIASNKYGAVTSSIANVTITTTAVLPVYTNGVISLTNYIGNNVTLNGSAEGGTQPFTYQWYFGTSQLSDSPNGSGSGYTGSGTATLTITNAQQSDSGKYYVTINNPAGGVSNLVVNLTIQYLPPSIPGGQQSSLVVLQGNTGTITVASVRGTAPLSYNWYIGKTNPVVQLSDVNEYSGTHTNVLTITGATLADATNYFCVVTNLGGVQTNHVVPVTVIVPPALSYVGYSNQVYFQNFDSLPNPFLTSVNTVGGGGITTIGSNTYLPANPFDFAFPVYTNITQFASGGLGLSNTMAGWYGECDADTAAAGAQIGASWGDQTTGGIISFGLTNTLALSSNRALGLIATSTSGGTHFGLKLINQTTSNLNYFTVQCTGEYWKMGTAPKNLLFTFYVDPSGNGSTLSSNEWFLSTGNYINGLSISNDTAQFPLETAAGTNGTLAVNQTNLSVTNFYLSSTPWTPGSALWLIWSMPDASSKGQGFGIDNLSFSAVGSTNVAAVFIPQLTGETFSATTGSTFSFTNIAGAASSFTVWSSTNVALPLAQWQNMGNPTEVSPGNYQFNDPAATGLQQRFYIVTSP